MIQKFQRSIYIFVTFIIYALNFFIGRKTKAQKYLFEKLSHLGGVYIKFLQLLALNKNTAGIQITNLKDILAVYDQVTFEDINITQLMAQELGSKKDLIHLDSNMPFAAGSFAQVYSGVLNNQRVIIKVLRPSVLRFLRFDLKLLSVIIHLILPFQPQNMLDLVSIFNDFKHITLEEIDYKHEVNNAMLMAKQLAGHPVIFIPQTYSEFSTQNIIVQERVDGTPLTELFSNNIEDKVEYVLNKLGTNLNYVMEELAVELLAGSLTDSGSHGDPHPGNVYLLTNNRIVLIDFGIGSVVQKHQPELLQLISQYAAVYRGEFNPEQFSQAMISYFVPELTHSMQTLSAYFGKQDLVKQTLHEIGLSVAKTFQDKSGDPAVSLFLDQYRMLYLFTEVINKNNRFGFRVTMETPAFLRSTQIFLQITRRLNCDLQLLRRAWERVLADNQNLTPTQSAAYNNESIDNSLHSVAGWFERLHCSDPGLYNRIMQNWEGAVI